MPKSLFFTMRNASSKSFSFFIGSFISTILTLSKSSRMRILAGFMLVHAHSCIHCGTELALSVCYDDVFDVFFYVFVGEG